MTDLTIHDIDDKLEALLKERAEQHGNSLEKEALLVLREVMTKERGANLAELAEALFGEDAGVELEPHPRVGMPGAPDFSAS